MVGAPSASANSATPAVQPDTSRTNQLTVRKAVTGQSQGQYYEVRAQHSNKCLDVAYMSQTHGADVVQGNCWGGTNQHWRLAYVGNGFYEVRAQHSDKCLDVAWASTAHAANVIQGDCWGAPNQHWRFLAVQ
jgi:hypothetical protein